VEIYTIIEVLRMYFYTYWQPCPSSVIIGVVLTISPYQLALSLTYYLHKNEPPVWR